MKKLLLIASFLFSIGIQAQTYLMGNGSNSYTTCSGTFYDSGGATGNYQSNENGTVTFFPSTPNSVLQVTFTSFDTEDLYDGLMIYNGPTAFSPLISSGLLASTNSPTTCPAGSWRGTVSPGTIVSTDPTGALTFVFASDVSVTPTGWVATITCVSNSPTYVITDGTATTCSGTFYDSQGLSDYLNSENYTYTIFPSTPGAKVQVNFTAFNTENLYDGLMIYNGSSTASPLISSGLPVGSNPTTCPAGSWRGTGSPGTVTSTDASGALTFVFKSDDIVVASGWAATISCVQPGNNYTMNNTAGFYTTCSGTFYDSGGLSSTYSASENSVLTFFPSTANSNISFDFSSFDTQLGFDTLYVYNGATTTAPLLGAFTGALGAGTLSANNPQGALTFKFRSNAVTQNAGWAATISCIPITTAPEINFVANFVQIPAGSSVNFTDLSTNNPTSWNWSFPGAVTTTSTLQNPANIQYNNPGCYEVTLTATNFIGSNTATATCYINVAPAGTFYCIPNPTNGTSDGDFINGVTLNTISNLNTGATNGPVYTYYNTFTTSLNVGQLYPLGIQSGTYALDVYAAWIDYNSDGDFADAGEKLGEFTSTTAFTTSTINFTVPTGTTSGYKIMRVRAAWAAGNGAANMSPCTDYAYGETEDYIVNIVVPNAPPVANFTSNVQNINVGQSVNFIDFSSNNPTTWSWTFTGAATTTSNVQFPTNITYNVAGCYPVTLVAGNAFGTNSVTQTCFINVTNPTAFCTQLHQNDCSSADNINSFSITGTTLQNLNSGCTSANSLGYTNYGPSENYTATLTRGQSYQFNLTSTSNSTASIWIDYNHNNLFDTNEWTQIATSTVPYVSSSVSIVIPTTALLGATAVRVRTRDFGGLNAATDPCTLFGSGETEDYTINLIGAGNGPLASFTASQTSICAGNCITFNNTTTGAGNNATFSWQFPGGNPTSSTSSNPGTVCYANQGTYTVSLTVTNANGSSTATQQITVNPATAVTISPGGSTSLCAGSTVNLNAIANSPNATFTWTPAVGLNNPSIANPIASPTSTTTYTVTAAANGCSATASVTVNVNPIPTVNAGNNVSICSGTSTNLLATSSAPNATYSWSPSTGLSNANIANPVASPTSTTTYTVTVNANNCSATSSVVVTVTPLPIVTITPGNSTTICSGASANLNALTNAPNATFSWSPATGLSNPNLSNPVASPTISTTYTVTVNANGCTATASVFVNVTPAPTVNAGQDVTICAGGSTNLLATSSSPLATFSWTPSAGLSNPNISSPVATPTQTTTYSVLVTVSGCTASDIVVVTVNNVTANAGQDASICPGGSTQLNASGGGTYLWTPSTGLSSANIANPIASPTSTTTYTVTVTNNGCTATDNVVVSVGSITANAGQDATICAGSSTNLSATGGTTYSWSPSSGLSNPNIANPIANPTSTTTYTVTVSNGACSATDQVIVTVNPLPTANAGQNVSICSGASTNLSASTNASNASFLWTPSVGLSNTTIANPTANPSQTTTYTVVVTSNGCSATASVTVTVNSVNATAGANTSICSGGSTQLSASGGTIYLWSPSVGLSNPNIANPIASPASTTTYSVTVTNNGCSANASQTVTVNTVNANAGQNQTICSGASTQLNATGGTSYLWSPSAGLSSTTVANPTASPISTTTYTVLVTNNGCTATSQVTVNVNSVNASAGQNVSICAGSSTQLLASGGTSYAWTPSAGLSNNLIANPIASPSSTTTYTVQVTNGNCSSTAQVTVTVINLSVNAGNDAVVCPGQSTQLNATSSNGVTYSWSPASGLSNANIANPVATPAQNTTYTVTVSQNGCSSSDQVAVSVNNFTASAGLDVTVCPTNSVQLNATGGTSYQWTPSTGLSNPNIANPLASPTVTTAYTVLVTNGNCSQSDVVIVTVGNVVASAGDDINLCSGQTSQLLATGGSSYSWTPVTGLSNANIANPIVSVSQTTTYTVTVSSGTCISTDQVVVTVIPGVTANAGQDANICAGGSVTLNGQGGTTFSWSPAIGLSNANIANPIANPIQNTTYILTTSNGNCTDTDTVVVTVSSVNANAGIDLAICAGQSVPLSATGGTGYSWSPTVGLNNANVSNPTANPSATTTYTVTVTNGACTASDQVTITVNSVAINAGLDTLICAGSSAQLQASSVGNVSYTWTPSNGLSNPFISNPVATPTNTTTYVVTASNGLCSSTDEVIVTVNALPAAPAINQNGAELVCGTVAASYQWFANGVLIAGATNQNYTPTANGTYTVEVYNSNGCSAVSQPFNFITVSINELVKTEITVYPNPNTGMFRISGTLDGNVTMDLVNILGEKIAVIYQGGSNSNFNQEVDFTNVANGVYFIRVNTNQGTILKKIIKN
ncbi:MAG: GEVED domain-containing protein [Bacteroidota bacterium]|jgi:PKD repeat protein